LLETQVDLLQGLKKRGEWVEELKNVQEECSKSLGDQCAQLALESRIQSLQQHFSASEVNDLWKAQASLQHKVTIQEELLQQLTRSLAGLHRAPITAALEIHPESFDDSGTGHGLFQACAESNHESESVEKHRCADCPSDVAVNRKRHCF